MCARRTKILKRLMTASAPSTTERSMFIDLIELIVVLIYVMDSVEAS